ncbi:hypothetical protein [Martelella mediterranea]|uniref:Uncharacterized protein n=1 Tax=Martelella mediterranea DSM 17316 TaxID=1122214 RepID=A0A1U9Z7R0_9HYPH|nr:hypothetical protein [Martelella mediterranea]AQZ53757.1 hypothetical protein Mame_04465 [Martelella mediterranea DSM 17316]
MGKRQTGISSLTEARSPTDRHTPPIRPDGLQLNENRTFQERFWFAERCAWLGFIGFVLLAVLGFTGAGGPFSATTKSSDTATIQLPAVTRWQTSDRMRIDFDQALAGHTVLLSAAFREAFQIESIQPTPMHTELAEGGHKLAIATNGDQRGSLVIDIRAQSPGRKRFAISVDGEAPVQFSTLVLP